MWWPSNKPLVQSLWRVNQWLYWCVQCQKHQNHRSSGDQWSPAWLQGQLCQSKYLNLFFLQRIWAMIVEGRDGDARSSLYFIAKGGGCDKGKERGTISHGCCQQFWFNFLSNRSVNMFASVCDVAKEGEQKNQKSSWKSNKRINIISTHM